MKKVRRAKLRRGRPAGPPANVRRNRVVIMVTDAELVRLTRLAEATRKPMGTVAYELFARGLARRP